MGFLHLCREGENGKAPFWKSICNYATTVCCQLGLTVIRRTKNAWRKCRRTGGRMAVRTKNFVGEIAGLGMKTARFLKEEIFNAILFFVTAPYHLGKAFVRGWKVGGPKDAFSCVWHVFSQTGAALLKHLRVLFSYALPAAALAFLLMTVTAQRNDGYVVRIGVNGEAVGCVEDESVYFEGESLMQQRIIYGDGDEIYHLAPQMTLERVTDSTEVMSAEELCNELIRHSGNVFEEAYGLYVDGVFYGATTEGETLSRDLQAILESYKTGAENETVRFHNDVQVRAGLYLESSMVNYGELYALMNSSVDYAATYTVVANDSPIRIASKNNIPLKTLMALNPEISEVCQIGQEVIVSADRPLLSVETTVVEEREVEVPYESVTVPDSTISYGVSTVSRRGKNGSGIETVEKVYVAGILTETNVLGVNITKEPVTEYVIRGTHMSTSIQPSKGDGTFDWEFKWPTRGGYQTCSINGYGGHTGMDIGGLPVGTPIYAAADGIVIKSVKNLTGYGYHIIIDHGNGVQTLYGHCNSLIAKVGDEVKQGDKIATLGATGNADGKHLHFEIRINGEYKDPADYIGTSYRKW